MLLGRLIRPLDYLRIRHSQKRKYDFGIPFVIAVVATLAIFLAPVPIEITGERGLLSIFTGLLQILIGFYIASLAAVSTFPKEGMDQLMAGTPPTLKVKKKGQYEDEKLTRRRFLSLMFGYLALSSLFLYFLGTSISLLEPNLVYMTQSIPNWAAEAAKWISLFVYLFMAANLLVCTLLGLYYMTDRIHR